MKTQLTCFVPAIKRCGGPWSNEYDHAYHEHPPPGSSFVYTPEPRRTASAAGAVQSGLYFFATTYERPVSDKSIIVGIAKPYLGAFSAIDATLLLQTPAAVCDSRSLPRGR